MSRYLLMKEINKFSKYIKECVSISLICFLCDCFSINNKSAIFHVMEV